MISILSFLLPIKFVGFYFLLSWIGTIGIIAAIQFAVALLAMENGRRRTGVGVLIRAMPQNNGRDQGQEETQYQQASDSTPLQLLRIHPHDGVVLSLFVALFGQGLYRGAIVVAVVGQGVIWVLGVCPTTTTSPIIVVATARVAAAGGMSVKLLLELRTGDSLLLLQDG